MGDLEKTEFKNKLLVMIVVNHVRFQFIKDDTTQALFRFLRPAIHLPTRNSLADKIMDRRAAKVDVRSGIKWNS